MFSISNILCDHRAGNEALRYGHREPTGAETQGHPRPVVVWAVTRRCNLRCVHCYATASGEPDPDELSFDEGVSLLEELRAYGVPAVLFSGGEPLARPDTLELIAHARALGLPCTLSTNGLLIDDAVAQRLVDLGVRYVGISIDGIGATHDRLRGRRGAFDRTVEAIRRCKHHGLKVGARFTVHALNRDQLDDVIGLCVTERVDRLCVYHLAYAGRGGSMQSVDLTAGQTRDVVQHLFIRTRTLHEEGVPLEVLTVGNHADAAFAVLALEHEDPARAAQVFGRLARTGGNRSGQNICSIGPNGDVYVDQFSWRHRVGSVRAQTFREIWAEPTDLRLRTLRARRPLLPTRCQRCRFVGLCNGNLRVRAEAATGDWLGMDPSCYLTDAETRVRSA